MYIKLQKEKEQEKRASGGNLEIIEFLKPTVTPGPSSSDPHHLGLMLGPLREPQNCSHFPDPLSTPILISFVVVVQLFSCTVMSDSLGPHGL